MILHVSQDGKRRYQEAIARKKIRLDRLVSSSWTNIFFSWGGHSGLLELCIMLSVLILAQIRKYVFYLKDTSFKNSSLIQLRKVWFKPTDNKSNCSTPCYRGVAATIIHQVLLQTLWWYSLPKWQCLHKVLWKTWKKCAKTRPLWVMIQDKAMEIADKQCHQYLVFPVPCNRIHCLHYSAVAHDLAEQHITAEQTLVQSLSSIISSLFNCKALCLQYNLYSTIR